MSKHIPDHIKVVLFDHDDTLVGTFEPKSEHHKYVARTYYGKELSDQEIREHWGRPFRELVGLLYDTADIDQAIANNTACHETFPIVLFTASIPTLRHVKDAGRLIGIITAASRLSFEHDLTLHNIPRELLDYTQAADDTPFHKPDPRVFEPALRWLKEKGMKPSEVVYVGDGLHDMNAALGAGFSFVAVETGLVTAEQFKEVGVTSIPSVADLI